MLYKPYALQLAAVHFCAILGALLYRSTVRHALTHGTLYGIAISYCVVLYTNG